MVPTRVSRRPTELRYVDYQVNDVKFLFQTSEQGLNARKDCSGCRPIVAPVYFRIFFEKFVKSAVNGANQDPCSVNIVLFSETSLEGRLFVNLAFVNITVETRPYHKLAPFLRPLSSHCAEHPAKDLPECSDPVRQDGLQGQVLAITA